jgi:hypothetical protein
MAAEEVFGRYNPSASNDKVLSLLQRYRDQDLDRLERQGQARVQAEREKLQNIAKIPDQISSGYLEGTEENRRERQAAAMERQQKLAEEQGQRQQELHPLDIQARKGSIARDEYGLSEEQARGGDAKRQRDWLNTVRPDGLTNEQYNFQLQQKGTEAQIQGTKNAGAMNSAQIGLIGDQRKEIADNRAIKSAAAQYVAAMSSGDEKKIAELDRTLGASMPPGQLQLAKNEATSAYKGGIESANLFWQSSESGQKTSQDLSKLRVAADIVAQLKSNIAEYNAAGFNTDKANVIKDNIVALLSRPEMGVEGQNAAKMVQSGFLGARFDRTKSFGVSSASERIDDAIQNIDNSLQSQLKQIELQNSHVRVPAYTQNLTSTANALNNALKTPTKKNTPQLISQPMNTLQPNAPAGQNIQPVNNLNPMQSPALPPASGFRDRMMRGPK